MNNKPFKRAKPSPARVIAFDLITQVNRGGAFANLRLPELLAQSGKHDYAIKRKIDRPFEELDEKVVDILRLGVHQIFEMRVPIHAAVSETVELARAVAGESKASYINALLRAIASEPDIYIELEADESIALLDKLEILYSHPKWIISAYFDQLKDWPEVIELLKINNIPAAPHIVAWPGKSSVAEILEIGGEKLPMGNFSVLSDHLPNEYPAVKDKRAGIQDMGSQLIAETLFATSNSSYSSYSEAHSWLDLCAGPGGKAALLNNLLEVNAPGSEFTANEPSEHRAELVARVVPRSKITSIDGRNHQEFGRTFDRILIDAPCSGLGALRRRPEARWRRSLNDLKELLPLQRDLIDSGYEMLNIGGIIGFATCSPLLAETKGQVLDALYRHKNLELLNIAEFSPSGDIGVNPDGTLQLWTHRQGCDGMFLALLKRTS